jgi:trk system potassium uptake protein TrkA
MRVVIVGATATALAAARMLVDRGHDVILVEQDEGTIERLSDELDCGFLRGDGTDPALLKEADPEGSDALFCLTNHDQTNILASLVGKALGFDEVITSVADPSFEEICGTLGLEGTVVPSRTIGRYLADLVEGFDVLELRTVVRGEARFFSFQAGEDDTGTVDDLELPDGAKVICLYRGDDFRLAEADTEIRTDDEVVVLTYRKNLSELEERWEPKAESLGRR